MAVYIEHRKQIPSCKQHYLKMMNATHILLLSFEQDPRNLVRVCNINDGMPMQQQM